MARSRQIRKASFFWQGLLILLPVAIIAFLGLAALRRDRNSVAEEGRQQAAQIAHQLAGTLESKVAGQLANVNEVSLDWLAYYSMAITDQVLGYWSTSGSAYQCGIYLPQTQAEFSVEQLC